MKKKHNNNDIYRNNYKTGRLLKKENKPKVMIVQLTAFTLRKKECVEACSQDYGVIMLLSRKQVMQLHWFLCTSTSLLTSPRSDCPQTQTQFLTRCTLNGNINGH